MIPLTAFGLLWRFKISEPLLIAASLFAIATLVSAQTSREWRTGQTGRGTARWIRQSGGLTYQGGAAFGWAVLEGTSLRDGWVETRFKPVDGREDRAGGVVWRWRDADNYYVARGNALENNVVAYKVVEGRRTDLTPCRRAAGHVRHAGAGGHRHLAHAPGRLRGQRVRRHVRRPAPLRGARRDAPGRGPGGGLVQGRQRHRVRHLPLRGQPMSTPDRILFVCLHGAAKSVLAAADFSRMAAERGLAVTTEAAGTEPDPEVAPGVLRTLRAEGLDLPGQLPRKVTAEDVARASRVVAFGCDLGDAWSATTRVEQWTDVPAVSEDLPAARAVIRRHLARLLDEIAAMRGQP
jgi:arsenate reductase